MSVSQISFAKVYSVQTKLLTPFALMSYIRGVTIKSERKLWASIWKTHSFFVDVIIARISRCVLFLCDYA
jgi:hypothetical protein